MTDSNGVQWFCHRCARKDDLELDADPVMLRVCDGCNVENWTRPLAGAVAVVEEAVVVHTADGKLVELTDDGGHVVVEEAVSEMQEKIDAIPAKLVDEAGEETTVAEVLEKVVEATKEIVEPLDPYKGMTKAQLLEELAKRG